MNDTQRVITKALGVAEDLAYGEGKVTQQRGETSLQLTKIRSFWPVNSQTELDELDPLLHPKAVLVLGNSIKFYTYTESAWQELVMDANDYLPYIGSFDSSSYPDRTDDPAIVSLWDTEAQSLVIWNGSAWVLQVKEPEEPEVYTPTLYSHYEEDANSLGSIKATFYRQENIVTCLCKGYGLDTSYSIPVIQIPEAYMPLPVYKGMQASGKAGTVPNLTETMFMLIEVDNIRALPMTYDGGTDESTCSLTWVTTAELPPEEEIVNV